MRFIITLIFLLFSLNFISQSAKKLFADGERLEKTNEFDLAILEFSKAIESDAAFLSAYLHRANCFERVNKKEEAAVDYQKAFALKATEKSYAYNAGRLFFELHRYPEANEMLKKSISLDNGYRAAVEIEIPVLMQLKDFSYGLEVTQMGINIKKTAESLFYHALMLDSLHDLQEAEKFYKYSLLENPKEVPAMSNLLTVLIKLEKFDEVLVICNKLLKTDPNNTSGLYARSVAYAYKLDYQNALNDITKLILLTSDVSAYKKRASFYETMSQYHNAVNDYNFILEKEESDVESYYNRALGLEHIQNYKDAIQDYKKILKLAASGVEINKELLSKAGDKLFDLGRESDKPEVETTASEIKGNTIKIVGGKKEFAMTGKVKDASAIKNIAVNSGQLSITDSTSTEFSIRFDDISRAGYLNISVTDIYDNTQLVHFEIEFIEADAPKIEIEIPSTTAENEISLEIEGPNLFIKGRIRDASLIESITLDGSLASFDPGTPNPEFTANLKIEKKDFINVIVRDIYGNENSTTYRLNRTGISAGLNNPMGNTWVVFIENTDYKEFSKLEGPAKDVLAMTSALANYKITKIITKKNMSKLELEKFFAIELRESIKNNNVTSLMIWYAGHGKFVSPTGYWIPVDGVTDEEFSYYSINSLRASMQSYAAKLTHILVITDACESGATFLMAMRGSGDEEKKCDDKELTRSKSAQVFTSAGFELASDNSYFTKGFVNSLNNNDESCISINKIVKKVTLSLAKNGGQSPKFGRIKDIDDEGGTFFFIKTQ